MGVDQVASTGYEIGMVMWQRCARDGRSAILALLLCCCVGCGERENTPTVVKGTALYRGEPMAGGMVVFAPNPERGGSGPLLVGAIQEDGSFILTPDDGKPIQAGWYRVSLAPRPGVYEVPTPQQPYPGPPPKYRNPAKSNLDREIMTNKENVFHFDLDDE